MKKSFGAVNWRCSRTNQSTFIILETISATEPLSQRRAKFSDDFLSATVFHLKTKEKENSSGPITSASPEKIQKNLPPAIQPLAGSTSHAGGRSPPRRIGPLLTGSGPRRAVLCRGGRPATSSDRRRLPGRAAHEGRCRYGQGLAGGGRWGGLHWRGPVGSGRREG